MLSRGVSGRSLRAAACAIVILLGACSKEAAVNRGLTDAGVPPTAADCMAQEMAERLSAEQLRKLARVSGKDGKTLAEMNAADYLAAARRVGDAEVVLVTAGAAAYCRAL